MLPPPPSQIIGGPGPPAAPPPLFLRLCDFKINMVLCNLIGRRRHHDIIDVVPKLAEKMRVNVIQFYFKVRWE